MDMILLLLMAVIGGIAIGYMLNSGDNVKIKDYEILLDRYESLKTKLNEKVYIGATYTNGYLDVIVLNFDKDTVWYVSDKNPINHLDRELFTDQFILKEE